MNAVTKLRLAGRDSDQRPLLARWLLLFSLLALLPACASMPGPEAGEAERLAYEEANDPLEPLNRYFFEVNRFLDEFFLKPIAVIYRDAVPQPVRTGVRNVLHNLSTPKTLINDLAQGETERAGESLGRFTGNTLIGVGGAFDVMAGENDSAGGIPYHEEDFGQTLAVWGVDEGPYLVLPLLGPSTVRDAFGRVVDAFVDPINFIVPEKNRLGFALTRAALTVLDLRARTIEALDEIERSSIDYYGSIRSLYRQRRRFEINNGQAPEDDPAADISAD